MRQSIEFLVTSRLGYNTQFWRVVATRQGDVFAYPTSYRPPRLRFAECEGRYRIGSFRRHHGNWLALDLHERSLAHDLPTLRAALCRIVGAAALLYDPPVPPADR